MHFATPDQGPAESTPTADAVICILDRSGSMARVQDDAIGGFNAFVEGIREDDPDGRLTLVLFDHEYDVVYRSRPLGDVPPLDRHTFVPRGMTALYDAVGRTLSTALESWIAMEPDARPSGVTVAILTDGLENASREHSASDIEDVITVARLEFGWEFVFLAANQDAILAARSIGIRPDDAAEFEATAEGTVNAMRTMRDYTTDRRRRQRGSGGR